MINSYVCDMTHEYVCDMTHSYVCDMTHDPRPKTYDSSSSHIRSFCSRMKRGILYSTCKRHGYGVLALGQVSFLCPLCVYWSLLCLCTSLFCVLCVSLLAAWLWSAGTLGGIISTCLSCVSRSDLCVCLRGSLLAARLRSAGAP